MKSQLQLFTDFSNLQAYSNSLTETWANSTMKGLYSSKIFALISKIFKSATDAGFPNIVKVRFDSEVISAETIQDYESAESPFKEFTIILQKDQLLSSQINGFKTNFFLKRDNCNSWLAGTNPLEEGNMINTHAPLKVIVHDLAHGFGGEHLYFLPNKDDSAIITYKNSVIVPQSSVIKENVHFITKETISFNPNVYILRQFDDSSSNLFNTLLNHSCITLLSTLVNEFYSNEKVTVDGIKRTTIALFSQSDRFDKAFNQDLKTLVQWIYAERINVRRKLFHDRLTLDMESNQTLAGAIKKYGNKSLDQAKERYNFVIRERKDAYIKELKELLKDLRGQSDLYANKIRSLLTNFLRDALGGLILVGFTLFTKFSDNSQLLGTGLLKKVFFGLAFYYILSVVVQAIVDWTDILITQKELKYWRGASRELIADEEFSKHYRLSLESRKKSLYALYPIIALLYLIIIIACFLYPAIFENLISVPNA